MSEFTQELHADYSYHVFNRTNNRELLFLDDSDRQLFIKKYKEYVMPYVETLTYCLLGNHFHLVLKVKSLKYIYGIVQQIEEKNRTVAQREFLEMEDDFKTVHILMASQFNRLFTSYAMQFNAKYRRSGNLFHRPFKRVGIKNEGHFTWLIYYVHANPKKHGICEDFQNYKWSSFKAFLSESSTHLMRNEVLKWFGGKSKFLEFHDQLIHDLSEVDYLLIED